MINAVCGYFFSRASSQSRLQVEALIVVQGNISGWANSAAARRMRQPRRAFAIGREVLEASRETEISAARGAVRVDLDQPRVDFASARGSAVSGGVRLALDVGGKKGRSG
jgi:hypothetical protein